MYEIGLQSGSIRRYKSPKKFNSLPTELRFDLRVKAIHELGQNIDFNRIPIRSCHLGAKVRHLITH